MARTPWPPPPNAHAALAPPTQANRARESMMPGGGPHGIHWARQQVLYPEPWIPFAEDNTIGTFPRFRPISVTGLAANASSVQTLNFDIPTTLYARVGGILDTSGAGLPANHNPLDFFTVQMVHTNGNQFDTAAALGGTLLGTAERPMLIGGPGWMMDRGSGLQITVVPLRNNLRIDIVLWGIEINGPANYVG